MRTRCLFAVVVCSLLVGQAVAQQTRIDIFAPNDVADNLTEFDKAVVTGRPVAEVGCGSCGTDVIVNHLVVLKHGQQPIMVRVLTGVFLKPGTRFSEFDLIFQGICTADGQVHNLYQGEANQTPTNVGTVLFEVAPDARVLDGHTGVVTGNTDDTGRVQVVFKGGGPAVKVWVDVDDYTEMADRLTEVTEVYSDEIGTIYSANLDY